MTRDITDILKFRQDITPFLAHLTRDRPGMKARDALYSILQEKELVAGEEPVSDARWGMHYNEFLKLDGVEVRRYFRAICFTETPISEIHCLLDISYRQVNLAPWGLVFMKEALAKRGASPVVYINNMNADKDDVMEALCKLIDSNPVAARKLLPLVTVFGQFIASPNCARLAGEKDFRWEREWRYPAGKKPMSFDYDDVFVGLCPHGSIEEMEDAFPDIPFIDPRRNMKWYASKLIEARRRHELTVSVV